MIFSYAAYADYLKHLQSIGSIRTVAEDSFDGAPGFILRHDVDLNVECAYQLFLVELEHGVRSSFFFMTTGATYNVASPNNRKKLKEMADAGFDIGLHFDPTLYPAQTADELLPFVQMEAEILRVISEKPILSVSLHEPSMHGTFPIFSGFRNAYDPKIFEHSRYISDSCRRFRGKDPFEFVRQGSSTTIQILLHPEHFSHDGQSYDAIFRRHLHSVCAEMEWMFKRGNQTVVAEIDTPFADRFLK